MSFCSTRAAHAGCRHECRLPAWGVSSVALLRDLSDLHSVSEGGRAPEGPLFPQSRLLRCRTRTESHQATQERAVPQQWWLVAHSQQCYEYKPPIRPDR